MARRDVPGAGSVSPADHPSQAFPDPEWAWLRERCRALGIPDPEPRREVLEALYGHLVGVNAWLNLTRITTPRDYLKLHVLDALSLWGDPRLAALPDGARCCDLGSGAGYPGIPLALWTPRARWTLVDSRRRKVDFLAAAASLTGLPHLEARRFRGREARAAAGDLVRAVRLAVTRATGAADAVLAECADLMQRHGHVVIFKGPAYDDAEHAAALRAAERLGYRFVTRRAVRLEEGDPERLQVVFEKR